MKYKKISIEEYKKNPIPIQFVGYYVIKAYELNLPEPEFFFVEDDEGTTIEKKCRERCK